MKTTFCVYVTDCRVLDCVQSEYVKESDCVLSDNYDTCYYVTPAYNKTVSHSLKNYSKSGSSSDTSTGIMAVNDESQLVALIEEFNANNHGLLMNIVRTLHYSCLLAAAVVYSCHISD